MSLGENRVRVTFNPSASSAVDQIKQKSAELINLVEEVRRGKVGNVEVDRLCSKAQESFEEAAMWAVKAATA